MSKVKLYFSDYFGIPKKHIEDFGAFNISLVSDLPLFIDPFLLFNSKKKEYQIYHERIIQYLRFLKDKSVTTKELDVVELKAFYCFPEIRQNWLGFSEYGNWGQGLGIDFARALHNNLHEIFKDFGEEKITKGTHLEKLCLIEKGVGKDKISDFTTNLIIELLLNYTQDFSKKYINKKQRKKFLIKRVRFNPNTETFDYDEFDLPVYNKSFVILTPRNLLTKDETWINRNDLVKDYEYYTQPDSLPNDVLRNRINAFFFKNLPEEPTNKDRENAIIRTILQYPNLVDYYIKYKENNGDKAEEISERKVTFSNNLYVENFKKIINLLSEYTSFYQIKETTYLDALKRSKFLKDIIENKGGYQFFYLNGVPIRREKDLQILYRLTWFGTIYDVSREVDDGRGSADYKVSMGSWDKSIVEFKLASNSQLKRNLQNQVEIYKKASDANESVKVIIFFTEDEETRVINILNELGIAGAKNIILIDARDDNKPSASKA